MYIKQYVLHNVFKKTHKKRALIIYTIAPFFGFDDHTNANEIMVMATLLDSLGYTVDVIDYEYAGDYSANTYNIIIGLGKYFEKCCLSEECRNATKVAYLTAKSPDFNNMAEVKRLRYFKERNGVVLPIVRYDDSFSDRNVLLHIDHAIGVGTDSLTRDTWKDFFSEIDFVNITGFDNIRLPDINKSEDCFSHFLWFGSTGGIHKGLDLLIEAFRNLPDLHLHIVGAGIDEGLANVYRDTIVNSNNIHYYGWLNHNDSEYLKVFESCGFVICPSCSEGQCTSVLTAMFAGMIPVCTRENGIEMELCDGYYIEDIRPESIASLLSDIVQTPREELIIRSKNTYDYVIRKHTIKNYQRELSDTLTKIISLHPNDIDTRSEIMKDLNKVFWIDDGYLCSSLFNFEKNKLYVLCPYGIGDTLYLCSFLKTFKEKNGVNSITCIIKESHKPLIEAFPDINGNICSDDLVELIHSWTRINNITRLKNYLFGHFELVPGVFDDVLPNPLYLYRNLVLGLSEETPLTPPGIKANNSSALREKYQLNNPTILVAPYAVSCTQIDNLFWEALVAILVEAGYQVYTNIKNDSEEPILRSMPISENITDTVAIASQCTLVISMRSGLCDIMAMCGVNLVTIDTVRNYFDTWNLSSLFDGSSISSYLYESPEDMEPLLKEILSLLDIQI